MKNIVYQLLPRLWGNGRFSGIDTPSLEYFRSLGANYVWYTGIIRHATTLSSHGCTPSHPQIVKGDAGSPYAITDYYDVNPYLADTPSKRMEELQALVSRTHAAGLKVLIDFVPNHVARDYSSQAAPSGVRSLGADDNPQVHWAPENDFFYYPGQPLMLPVPYKGKGYFEYPAKASGNCFSPAPALTDWYETIKINYCDFYTGTWEKMRQIVRFWAAQGVDGFRCDMVELVPWQFMQWLIREIKAEFPQLIFIAEVYEKEKYPLYVSQVGFDYLYDKSGLYDTLRAVTCDHASAQGITWNWQSLDALQPRMLNFLENHDEQRLASDFFCGSPQGGYAALAVSLLQNTASFMLYFGQEIGERGMGSEPFSGLNGRTSIFDWCTVDSLQRLSAWIHASGGLLENEKTVLQRYQSLLALSGKPAFREGATYDLCYCQDGAFNPHLHYAWLRSSGKETWLLAANFGPQEELTVRIPPEALQYLGIKAVRTVYTLTVPQKDYVIIPVE